MMTDGSRLVARFFVRTAIPERMDEFFGLDIASRDLPVDR